MKNKIIISIFLLTLFLTSCENNDLNTESSVMVNPEQVIKKLNDTLVVYKGQPLEFQFSGTSDLITFYSGEVGRKYANKNRIIANGTPKLDFQFNSNRVLVAHDIDVLASTDFKGVYDSINIKNANWDKLTPSDMKDYRNTNIAKSISTIDLTNYGGGKPVFIAFKLGINSTASFSNPTISNLSIKNYQLDGVVANVTDFAVANMNYITLSPNGKWKANGGSASGNTLWRTSGTAITVNTTTFPTASTLNPIYNSTDGRQHELWAISKVLFLDKVLPDTGVTIKNIQQRITNYLYTYNTNGVYNVSFVNTNTNSSGIKNEILNNFIIKVIDKP
jgi:hypothetical protein